MDLVHLTKDALEKPLFFFFFFLFPIINFHSLIFIVREWVNPMFGVLFLKFLFRSWIFPGLGHPEVGRPSGFFCRWEIFLTKNVVVFLTQSWYQAWNRLISRKEGMCETKCSLSLSLFPFPYSSITVVLDAGQAHGLKTFSLTLGLLQLQAEWRFSLQKTVENWGDFSVFSYLATRAHWCRHR